MAFSFAHVSGSHPSTVNAGIIPNNGGGFDTFPLKSSQVQYELVDVHVLANLIQTYTAKTLASTEAQYIFPLPPDAAIGSFKATIDGTRIIEGVIREKDQAAREYSTAISQGRFGALLQQSNAEIFKVSLGNLNPGEKIEIHISFCSIITHDGELDTLRLTFPTTLAPRYGAPPLNFTGVSLRQIYLEFSLAVQLSSPIQSISSPSHPISVRLGGHTSRSSTDYDAMKAYVTLSSSEPLDKDIVLTISSAGLDKPRCFLEAFMEAEQEATRAYALTMVPRFQLPTLLEQDYIFLVDRSGSMDWGKMAAVRSALQIMIKSLPTRGTFFNIISFGSRHSLLWPTSVPYSTQSVKMAEKHIDSMSADYGGTEIGSALQGAFNSCSNPRMPASIFVLTDGQSYDLDIVKKTIVQAKSEAKMVNGLLRVFSMGIGDQTSRAMCEDIARAGDGCAVFVGENEPPHEKLTSLLRAARSAPVEDLNVDWLDDKGLSSNIEQAPAPNSLGPIYPQFRYSIFVIATASAPQFQTVRLRGSVQGQSVELNVPVTVVDINMELQQSKKLIHTLAARALVRRYEDLYKKADGNELLHLPSKEDILRVALRFGIVSSQTSFVAIDESNKMAVEAGIQKVSELSHAGGASLFAFGGGGGMLSGSSGGTLFGNTAGGTFGSLPGGTFSGSSGGALFGNTAGGTFGSLPGGTFGGSMFGSSANTYGTAGGTSGSAFKGTFGDTPTSTKTFGGAATSSFATASGNTGNFGQSSLFGSAPSSSGAFQVFGSTGTNSSEKDSKSLIESFARRQSFEGYFEGTPEIYTLLFDSPDVPKLPDEVFGYDDDMKRDIWITALCIIYLENKLKEQKAIWELMVNKARDWMSDVLQQLIGAEKLESVRNMIYEAATKELKV